MRGLRGEEDTGEERKEGLEESKENLMQSSLGPRPIGPLS